ncbi:MAG: alpha/beta fold hydrolase [Clostridia bacterium]|nr:alpha/beta fold hydrolase [Clostridia bacterium]
MKKLGKVIVGSAAALAGFGVAMNTLVLTPVSMKNKLKREAKELEQNPPDPNSPQEQMKQEGYAWLGKQNSEHVVIKNHDGERIHSFIVRAAQPTTHWVVMCHGYTSSPERMGEYALQYQKQGYNILLPAMRGHGVSETKFISMGWKDRLDVIDWIHYLVEEDENAQIVLHGVSMGSATVMMVTGEELPVNVKCCVADCGYSSVWDEFNNELKTAYHLPTFPFLYAADAVTKLVGGYGYKEASSIKQLQKSHTPTLFIHGEEDKFVPYRMLDLNYNAAACPKEKLSIPDAEHAEARRVHPEIYWPAVWTFVGKYVEPDSKPAEVVAEVKKTAKKTAEIAADTAKNAVKAAKETVKPVAEKAEKAAKRVKTEPKPAAKPAAKKAAPAKPKKETAKED